MLNRRTVAVAVVIVCLGGLAIAQDEDLPLSNWGALPYWTPAVTPQAERAAGGSFLARTEGMRARTQSFSSSPLPFVAIAPCRIVDTRVASSDGFHQPNFADDETRTFNFPASPDCPGLPATAGAYSVNIQFRPTSRLAYLTAFPTGTTMPTVATLVGNPAWWTTNAAIVPAGTGGQIDIYCQFAGPVVIDINGYYAAQSLVSSLNTLTGDVTLAQGSNVTITPSGNTLTIAASAGSGGVLPTGTTGQTLYDNGSSWIAVEHAHQRRNEGWNRHHDSGVPARPQWDDEYAGDLGHERHADGGSPLPRGNAVPAQLRRAGIRWRKHLRRPAGGQLHDDVVEQHLRWVIQHRNRHFEPALEHHGRRQHRDRRLEPALQHHGYLQHRERLPGASTPTPRPPGTPRSAREACTSTRRVPGTPRSG